MMSKNYAEIYSSQEVMSKKLCFSVANVVFDPIAVISSLNAPKNEPILLSSFTGEQLAEMEEYAKGYTEKPYVMEVGGYIYLLLPSIYPTATSCLLLRMGMKPSVFLRYVRECPDMFVLSEHIISAPVRMSPRLEAGKKEFLGFCADIERTLMHLERFSLTFDDDDVIDGYYEQIIALSNFFAVPIDEISVKRSDDGVPIKSNFAIFTAFCATIMMLARNEAIDRKISAELEAFGGSVVVHLSFKTEKSIKITNETFLWDYLASNRRMFFEYYNDDGRFCVNFQPIFRDWAYLGIKQERNDKLEFDCE